MPIFIRFRTLSCALLLGILWAAMFVEGAEGKKFHSQLVWCTDKAKPEGQKRRPLDAKLEGTGKKIFKWKNYFEISRKIIDLPKDDGNRIRISNRYAVVIREMDAEQIEVELYGDKKLTGKVVERTGPILNKGEHLVIGGDDQDNDGDAWLLVLSAAPQSE